MTVVLCVAVVSLCVLLGFAIWRISRVVEARARADVAAAVEREATMRAFVSVFDRYMNPALAQSEIIASPVPPEQADDEQERLLDSMRDAFDRGGEDG